ncbi:hypothetical protein [Paraburkholderia flava]|uniref:hypothetical protein n=1 Tax=Paraburkholderia flava TaxID=2547393 RepID=UPI00105FB0B3|nr:hypothetical protein [Paraburkholderia flava]
MESERITFAMVLDMFRTMVPLFGIVFALMLASRWMLQLDRRRKEDMMLKREEMERAATRAKQEHERDTFERHANQQREERAEAANSGGYIVMDMPEDQKRMFHDVLKGFEEFAQLKGYAISFSLDGSLPDKVAFKFTIRDQGVTVSTQTVKKDLQEYIERVKSGDDLDDLPVVVPDNEHAALILAMRNRISFLQLTYKTHKNAVEFYERILRNAGGGTIGVAPAQNFYLQGAGSMEPKNQTYTAIGSSRVVQGEHIQADQSIRIGSSMKEKQEQVDNLDSLIAALTQAHTVPTDDSKKAIVNLEKVKSELTDEAKPDGNRIMKWLETAKASIKVLALGKDALDLAEKVYHGFNLPS